MPGIVKDESDKTAAKKKEPKEKKKGEGKCPNCGGKLIPSKSPAKTYREWVECEDCQLMMPTDKVKKQPGSDTEGPTEVNENLRMASKKEAANLETDDRGAFQVNITPKDDAEKMLIKETLTSEKIGKAEDDVLNKSIVVTVYALDKENALALIKDTLSVGGITIEASRIGECKKKAEIDKQADFENQTLQSESMPKELVSAIRKIQDTIPKEILDETEDEPKYLDKGLQVLLHTTILFGIEQDEKDKMAEIVKKYTAKGIKVKSGSELKYFDNDNTACYVPVNGEDLTK